AFVFDKISLENRCLKYWDRYLVALSDSIDGELLLEQANFNQIRKAWLQREFPIKGLHRTKRYVEYISVVEKCLQWCADTYSSYSIMDYDILDVMTLEDFVDIF